MSTWISENIEIFECIGRGGMGEVWKGELKGDGGFQRKVAVKLLLPHLTEDSKFRSLFLREAKLLAKFNHPGIVHVYSTGEYEGRLFIVFEYIDGLSLRDFFIASAGVPLPRPTATYIAQCIARALRYIAQFRDDESLPGSEMVHRDLTPHNVMLDRNGTVKVIDFGLAKVLGGETSATLTGVKGKPSYIAPECLAEGPYTVASDQYSLGVILFELFSGAGPANFSGTDRSLPPFLFMKTRKELWETFKSGCSDESLFEITSKLLDRNGSNRNSGFAKLISLPAPREEETKVALSRLVDLHTGRAVDRNYSQDERSRLTKFAPNGQRVSEQLSKISTKKKGVAAAAVIAILVLGQGLIFSGTSPSTGKTGSESPLSQQNQETRIPGVQQAAPTPVEQSKTNVSDAPPKRPPEHVEESFLPIETKDNPGWELVEGTTLFNEWFFSEEGGSRIGLENGFIDKGQTIGFQAIVTTDRPQIELKTELYIPFESGDKESWAEVVENAASYRVETNKFSIKVSNEDEPVKVLRKLRLSPDLPTGQYKLKVRAEGVHIGTATFQVRQ